MSSMTEKSDYPEPARKTNSPLQPKAFGTADFVYIGICVLAFLGAAFLFWNDLNMTLTRLSDKPVGTVIYKNKSAQRRFVDRVLWDRLKQESPVYNGDYIRTAELSQATVNFTAGGEISLEENTLIQIRPEAGRLRIELDSGFLFADARTGTVSIAAGDTVIEAAAGSLVQTAAGVDQVNVFVLEGAAEIRENDRQVSASAGDVYSSDAGGAGQAEAARTSARVAMLSPRAGIKLLNTGGAPVPVTFRWSRIGFRNNETAILDIAEDRGFSRIVATLENVSTEAVVLLNNGTYYWRAYPSSEAGAEVRLGGVSGRLTVVASPAPRLLSPSPGEVFRFTTTRPGIRFQWTACEGASAYLVEAADNPGIDNPFYRSQIQAVGSETGSVVHSGLESGTYYWRVTPVYSRDFEGTPPVSVAASFRVEKAAVLAAPKVRDVQGAVYLEGEQDKTYFTWEQEDEAVSYTFLLSQREDLADPVIRETVRDNYYAFDVKAAGLDSGRYYWGVYQTDAEGNDSTASTASMLVIVAGSPPEQRAETVVPPAVIPAEPEEKPTATASPPPAAATPPVQAQAAAPQAPPKTPSQTAVQPVQPPPAQPVKLSPPANLRPAGGSVITDDILMRDRRVDFTWNPVSGAASYVFSLHQGGREVLRQTVTAASFSLTDLSLLDEGSFTWRVQAVPANRNTALPSDNAESRFTVRLEETQAAQGQQSGIMFGNE